MEGHQPPAGEIYMPIEGGNGEIGFYLVSDGSGDPVRVRMRPPCFNFVAAMPTMTIGHYVAAIRELFEEAGIFLARRGSQFVSFDDPIEAARFAEYRNQLVKRTTTMEEVVRREHLRLAFDGMIWFAHWLTPEIEIKRYDTRFFIASAPPTQGFAESDGEITEAIWLDPATAITRCRREEIALPPPTWTTLRMLESFSSIKSVYQWVAGRRVVLVQPKFKKGVDTAVLTLPGDESYPPIPGFETPKEAINGLYIDKKCPFTGNVSIRGRILRGVVKSTKMKNAIVIKRNYLHFIQKYQRYMKRHKNFTVHCSPCFEPKVGDEVICGQCRPLSKTIRYNVVKCINKGSSGGKQFSKR